MTITSVGKKAKLNNCTVFVNNTSNKVYNLTISNSKDFCEGIVLKNTTNAIVQDNKVYGSGFDGFTFTAYNMTKCTIKGNYFESAHTQTNMRIYSSDNNSIINNTVIGYANGIYLCAYGGEISNNNLISQNRVIGKSEFSTCYTIQVMGNNNIVEKNTVSGGNRGISSENSNIIRNNDVDAASTGIFTEQNSTIENNNIHVSKKSNGITVNGKGSVVKNNTIRCNATGIVVNNKDISIVNNTIISADCSIESRNVPRGFTGIKVINNTLTGDIYNTGTITLTNNKITGIISNVKGKTIASNNRISNDTNLFKIDDNRIIRTDTGNFIPENASVSIYENGKLIKKVSMTDSLVKYNVTDGRHYYELIVTNTSNNSFKNNNFSVNNEDRLQPIISYYAISSAKINTTIKISGKLLADNKAVKGESVTIKVNGKKFTSKTSNTGYFTINYNVTDYGKHSVVFSFVANDKYLSAKNSTSFSVQAPAQIQYYAITGAQYGKTIKISGKLLSNNKAVKDETVTITVNKEKFTTKTYSSGYFTINYKVTQAGKNTVVFSHLASDNYKYCKNTTTFTVKAPTQIEYYTITDAQYGKTIKISGKLLSNNKAVKDKTITITVNNKKFTAKTYSSGYFTINYKIDSYGSHKVTLEFAGDSSYKASKNTTTFAVKKATSITPYKITSVKKGESTKISGKLLANNSAVKKASVKIKVNNKEFSVTTSNTGYFTLNYPTTTVGTNKVTLSYAGSSSYLSCSKQTTFSVK